MASTGSVVSGRASPAELLNERLRGCRYRNDMRHGFTLIELSIVLVIIGLIVGGVLVGQNLLAAAAMRAQISQIDKYNTAANSFYGKCGYLPGDIPAAPAAQFGFAARGQYAGEGDGNGIVEGVAGTGSSPNYGNAETAGETVMFWADLSSVGMIEGSFSLATSTTSFSPPATSVALLFPAAAAGNGNYLYVFESYSLTAPNHNGGVNYYGLSAITGFAGNGILSSPGLTVQQAYSIDRKVDDGLPQTGTVVAFYLNSPYWPAWAGNATNNGGNVFTTATSGSSTSCFDNGGGAAGVTQAYSLTQGGSAVNCALSFKFH